MSRYLVGLLLGIALSASASGQAPVAGPPATPAPAPPPDPLCGDLPAMDPFRAGACSLQFMAGYYPMVSSVGPVGPELDYVPFALRLGYALNDPHPGRHFAPGVFEIFLEYFAAPITRTFGSYITGPSLILRYTHYDPSCVVQPYIQFGSGVVFTDAHKAPVYQELIGQSTEFLLQAALGLRVMVTERFSVDVEAGIQHISNAGIAERNGGINNFGISIGATYSFGRPCGW